MELVGVSSSVHLDNPAVDDLGFEWDVPSVLYKYAFLPLLFGSHVAPSSFRSAEKSVLFSPPKNHCALTRHECSTLISGNRFVDRVLDVNLSIHHFKGTSCRSLKLRNVVKKGF